MRRAGENYSSDEISVNGPLSIGSVRVRYNGASTVHINASPHSEETTMIRASIISKVIAPIAVALSVGGFAAAADAAPYNRTCAGGICFNKDTQGYKNDKTYFYLTFSGSAVTHYNVRYQEVGGRVKQGELRTYQGSNKSQESGIYGTPGKKYYISIQACSRVQVKIGPFSTGTKSSCTGWVRIGYYAV
jgi:hypothetical protein